MFSVVSCKKERTIHISAKNVVTGLSYPGLTYYVVQKKTGLDGEEFKTMATGTLNADGEAFLTMKLKKEHSYVVRVEEPSNICYFNELAFHFANQESNFNAHFEYAECGNLKLEVQNINCEGPGDEIFFNRTWLEKNSYGNGVTKEGCFSFEGDFFELPEGQYLYEWEVTRNGNTTYHDSLFYINKDEMYTFLLEY